MTWRSLGWRLAVVAALAWPTIATAQDSSPFKRFDDFPPDDFMAALGWAGGGAGSEGTFCQLKADGQLLGEFGSQQSKCILGLNDILEVFIDDSLVKEGWSQRDPVTTSANAPDGALLEEVQDEYGNSVLSIPLDAQLGTYSLKVTQGARTATAEFQVVARADKPIIRAVPRQPWKGPCCPAAPAPLGSTVDVRLAGFAPNQTVKLMLFDSGENNVFRSTIATLKADSLGRARYPLQIGQDDPMGSYQIQTVPEAIGVSFPRGHGAPLCLTTPGNADPCLFNFRPENQTELFQRLVSRSNQVWADAAVANGSPSTLRCVFGGSYLSDINDSLSALHQRGGYATIHETAPPTIQRVTKLEDATSGEQRVRVDVVEHLAVLVFDNDDSLINDLSGDHAHRYTFSQSYEIRNQEHPPAPCETGWVIVADDA